MSTFFTDFFPTPENLARKMVNAVDNLENISYVLEPSAGKGDLLDAFVNKYKSKRGYTIKISERIALDAVEIEPALSTMLRGKDYNVVWDDFLTFEPARFYDLILANFPFSVGAEHLLKAIDIQERMGGQIVCLINAETIKNPFSNNRKVLLQKLDEYNASVEFIEDSFSTAERKTNVEVALINIKIPMKDDGSLFNKVFEADYPDMTIEDSFSLAQKRGKVESLICEYEMIRKSAVNVFTEIKKTQIMLRNVGLSFAYSLCDLGYGNKTAISINEFIDNLNLKYWNKLIDETDLLKKLPSELRNTFNQNMERQKHISFNADNVRYFCEELMQAIPQSYEKTVAKVFDSVTRKYHYSDTSWNSTIHYFNGWKTNDAFKVNKKVIIPSGTWYSLSDVLLDLNKIFENLSGKKDNFDQYDHQRQIVAKIRNFDKKIETTFFVIDAYKKGTMHIHFKDQELLDKFNILAAKGKNWLPPSFGKKPFHEMDTEEKDVVLSFGFTVEEYNSKCLGQPEQLRLTA